MNVAFLAGHNSIRQAVMGTENRAPTPAELERMKQMVARSMGEGAFGMSTGLRYIPGYWIWQPGSPFWIASPILISCRSGIAASPSMFR